MEAVTEPKAPASKPEEAPGTVLKESQASEPKTVEPDKSSARYLSSKACLSEDSFIFFISTVKKT